jgi:predicted RNase H-like HicB family nuclease
MIMAIRFALWASGVTEMEAHNRSRAGFVSLLIETRFDPEVGRFVSGSPELDVWSSGDTNTQAEERAQEAIILFLEEVARLGTIWEILDEAGLTVHRDVDVAQHLAERRVGFSIPAAARPVESTC